MSIRDSLFGKCLVLEGRNVRPTDLDVLTWEVDVYREGHRIGLVTLGVAHSGRGFDPSWAGEPFAHGGWMDADMRGYIECGDFSREAYWRDAVIASASAAIDEFEGPRLSRSTAVERQLGFKWI